MRIQMSYRLVFAILGVILAAAACSSSDESGAPDVETSIGGEADATPSGEPLVEGIPAVNVFEPPESGAGEVPLFRWEPVAGASRYLVAVLGPDGPLWGWQGEETEIYLGGLPFERPPGIAGPVIVAGTCWSVMVRDDEGHVMAVSEFLPVSPAESTGHTCVPGTGAEGG